MSLTWTALMSISKSKLRREDWTTTPASTEIDARSIPSAQRRLTKKIKKKRCISSWNILAINQVYDFSCFLLRIFNILFSLLFCNWLQNSCQCCSAYYYTQTVSLRYYLLCYFSRCNFCFTNLISFSAEFN